MVTVHIGRTSGPCTDMEVQSDFYASELSTIEDVLAMINRVTDDKERWYIRVDDGPEKIPTVK